MSTDPKQIKVQIVVEQAGFRKLEELFAKLTKQAQELGREMNRIGGLGGGGIITAGGKATTSGSSGANNGLTGVLNQRTTARIGGTGSDITKVLVENRNFIRGMSTGSKEAMKDMKDSVRDSIRDQVAYIEVLREKLKRLNEEYRTSSKQIRSGKLSPLAIEGLDLPGIDKERAQVLQELIGSEKDLRNARGVERDMGAKRFGRHKLEMLAGAWGGEGAAEQMANFTGTKAGGILATGVGATTLGYAIAIGLSKALGGAGQMIYGQQLAATGNELFRKQSTMVPGQIGQMANALRAGSISTYASIVGANRDRDISGYLTKRAEIGENARVGMATAQAASSPHQSVANWAMSFFSGAPTPTQVAKMKALPETQLDVLEGPQLWREKNPVRARMFELFEQQAASRAGHMRQLGMGWRRSGKGLQYDAVTGAPISETKVDRYTNTAANFLLPYQGRGLEGEILSMIGSMQGQFGRGVAHQMGGAALEASLGGLTNAAHIAGTGAVYSTAGGSRFLRAVTGMNSRGRGGIDAGAVNILGGIGAAGLADGAAASSGLGYLGSLQAFARGSSAGQDVRFANQIAAGEGAFNRLFQGSMDPFQTGLNTLNAIKALPNASIYGQDFLATKMTPRLLGDILSGENVPQELLDRGVTADGAKQFAKDTISSSLFRYIDTGKNTKEDQFVKSLQGFGGDLGAYYKAGSKGLKGKALKEFQGDTVRLFGEVAEDTGFAESNDAGQGLARRILGLGSTAKKYGGMGDPVGKEAPELHQLKAFANETAKLNKDIEDTRDSLIQMSGQLNGTAKTIERLGFESLSMSAAELNKAFESLIQTTYELTEAQNPSTRASHIMQEVASKASFERAIKFWPKDSQHYKELMAAGHSRGYSRTPGPLTGAASERTSPTSYSPAEQHLWRSDPAQSNIFR